MRPLAANIMRGQNDDTLLFLDCCIFFLDGDLNCQQAKLSPHCCNSLVVAHDCCGDYRHGLEAGKMIQLEIKGHDGEWSELLADSPTEAINELIEIIQREGVILALEWAQVKPHVEF